ncbi:MAG TPA: tRNA uridine-5-carboxymethylaminomethyl(34) synthesis enzyme MnmG, partial [bacterium (Candidatus Stahlbacteria)]|nr:tRNA uridine-5-carboxymethylaminomethyl(34) synthesis enzyme MnmG [Candidatus Stahlbacteria bacterium]
EAAAQGLIAGINAALKIRGEGPFILKRSEAYIGVLIDDLVTKGTEEPYRMFTSRAEHRLVLRVDNVEERIMPHACRLGLADQGELDLVEERRQLLERDLARLKKVIVHPEKVNGILEAMGENLLTDAQPLFKILKRPRISYQEIAHLDPQPVDDPDLRFKLDVRIKYDGYIEREERLIKRLETMEKEMIPEDFDYGLAKNISNEAREKLFKVRPRSLGQASRISGITPADILNLTLAIRRWKS